MNYLNATQKTIIFLALWIIGAIAIAIHIKMLHAGVPHPSKGMNVSVGLVVFLGASFLQILGMLWFLVKFKANNKHLSNLKLYFFIFLLYCALQGLIIRLPSTAGYAIDQKYLFYWLYEYLPKILEISVLCIILIAYSSLRTSKYAVNAQCFFAQTARLGKAISQWLCETILVISVLCASALIDIFLVKYNSDGVLQ